jgi:L-serine dehydratase
MNGKPPSIFNDVIGPVMRGPSSSHTAAAVRIGLLARQFSMGRKCSYSIEFEPKGSLSSTYSSQGSDIGLVGGLLGMDTANPRLGDAIEIAPGRGLEVSFHIVDFEAAHPNTYRIHALADDGNEDIFIFVSTGGGMIELREINEIAVSIAGDFHETLLFLDETEPLAVQKYKEVIARQLPFFEYCHVSQGREYSLINIKTGSPLPKDLIESLQDFAGLMRIVELRPVLTVLSRKECSVPFSTAEGVLAAAETGNLPLFKLALSYESERGSLTTAEVIKIAEEMLAVMRNAINAGLSGTDYDDRILGPQADKIKKYDGSLIGGSQLKKVIAYITALMETKSAMGVIVAAPTAGSCAALPGTLLAVADEFGFDDHTALEGLLAAGMVGVLIAMKSTFAAEECGCQAECGSGSAMAAAALVQMVGGTAKQALDAASIALQNIMGLVCDPVANRVEVPCLGKNVLAGMNAIAAANMALAGFDPVIPLDETITAFDQVGRMLPPELRCTGKAGLSITPASQAIAKRLNRDWNSC